MKIFFFQGGVLKCVASWDGVWHWFSNVPQEAQPSGREQPERVDRGANNQNGTGLGCWKS